MLRVRVSRILVRVGRCRGSLFADHGPLVRFRVRVRYYSVLHSWVSNHGCAPFTAGVAWLSNDYW